MKESDMLSKEVLIKQIESMPDKFTVDELVERLVFTQKIESGILDSDNGNKVSEEQLENEIKKWFK